MSKKITSLLLVMALGTSYSFAQKRDVLFIGNSYTAGMPNVVKQIATAFGDTLNTFEVSPGGFTLQGHSTDATTLNAIQQQAWDIVVLQEQSQKPSFSPTQVANDVFPYAKTLDGQIKANNNCTETMFYMTWGRKNGDQSNCINYPPICTYEGMQQRLRDSYMQMAQGNDGVVSPVGAAWKVVRDSVPTINLYAPDESHPSNAGVYLNACVFYASIFHKSPVGCTYTGSLSASDAGKLQYFAAKVVLDSLNQWIQHGDYVYAEYSYTVTNKVNFTNQSINATSYLWDFGTAGTSTLTNPSIAYAAPGKYEVTLTASNGCFSEKRIDSIEIKSVGINEINKTNTTISIAQSNNRTTITNINDKPLQLDVYSINGRKIYSSEQLAPKETLYLQLLPGIYFYRLIDRDKKVLSKKFLVY